MNNHAGTLGDSVKNAAGAVQDVTYRATTSARSKILDGLYTASKIITILRSLDVDDALGWVGLSRRRSIFGTVATFGAGCAVGVGVGLMMAPMSGKALRNLMYRKLANIEEEAKNEIVEAAKKAEQAVETELKPKTGSQYNQTNPS